jgi:DNA topoisomerase-1
MPTPVEYIQTFDSYLQKRRALQTDDHGTGDAQVHAPKGGVSVKGKKFIGGQFIPKEGGYQEAYLKSKGKEDPAAKEPAEEKTAKEPNKKNSKEKVAKEAKAAAPETKEIPKANETKQPLAKGEVGKDVEAAYASLSKDPFPNPYDFANKDLRGLDFKHEAFKAVSDDLYGTELRRIDFSGSDLSGVDFTGVNANTAKFEFCNLTGAKFDNVNLAFANLSDANITDIDIVGARDLTNIRLENAKCSHLSPANKAVMNNIMFEKNLFNEHLNPILTAKENKKIVETNLSKATGVAKERCNEIIQEWASTSADSSHKSIAAQLAAKAEFRLRNASTDHYNTAIKAHALSYLGGDPDLKKITQTQYDHTQRWFAQHGFKPDDTILLYRGLRTGKELGKTGETIKDLTMEEQTVVLLYNAIRGGVKEGKEKDKAWEEIKRLGHDPVSAEKLVKQQSDYFKQQATHPDKGTVKLQPLSSFSSSYNVARSFSDTSDGVGIVFASRIKVRDIFSHPLTGYGCTDEREFVVLGGEKEFVSVKKPNDIKKLFTEDEMTKDADSQSIDIDKDLTNADWTKHAWDLPKFGSEEFSQFLKQSGMTMEHFKTLPAYKAVTRVSDNQKLFDQFLSRRKTKDSVSWNQLAPDKWESSNGVWMIIAENRGGGSRAYDLIKNGDMYKKKLFSLREDAMRYVNSLPTQDADFKEQEHPRGQPENKGQFVKKGNEAAGSTKKKYSEEETSIANKTSRTAGAVGMNAIVPRHVVRIADPKHTILDFGAGKDAAHAKMLKEKGLKVTAYEFGGNVKEGLHDPDALDHKHDIVYASNVLNVQSSKEMLRNTLEEIKSALEDDGTAVFNYPDSPRKSDMKAADVARVIKDVFGVGPKREGGTASAPLWEVNLKGKAQTGLGIVPIPVEKFKKVECSATKHLTKEGTFTPERQKLHDDLVTGTLKDIKESAKPEFVMLGGGTASGKSTVKNNLPHLLKENEYANLDADSVKTHLVKEMIEKKDPTWAAYSHEESGYVVKRMIKASLESKKSFVLDGTGNTTLDKVLANIEEARRAGYKVTGIYSTVSIEEALRREEKRAANAEESGGRKVPKSALINKHRTVSQLFPDIAPLFDSLELYNAEVPFGEKPILIATCKKGQAVKVVDKDAYKAFLDKANYTADADEEKIGYEREEMILIGAALGKDLSENPVEKKYYEGLLPEIDEIKEQGFTPDIPFEIPFFGKEVTDDGGDPIQELFDKFLSKRKTKDEEAFKEEEHPRGQPENQGQFVAKGQAVKSSGKSKVALKLPSEQEPKDLSKKIVKNNELYKIFTKATGAGPIDGGCYAMAKALQKKLGGDLVSVASSKQAEHVVLKSGDDYWDGDGKSTKEQLLKRWSEEEGIKNLSLRPFKESDVPDSPRDQKLIDAVAVHLGVSNSEEPKKVWSRAERTFADTKRDKKGNLVSINGSPLPEHIAHLGIPPAWKDVRYNPDPDGELLVRGTDEAGRRQPLYTKFHDAESADAKWAKTDELNKKFNSIKKENETFLKDKEKAEAALILKLVMQTGIRVGSEDKEEIVAKVKAYGATTLLGQHIKKTKNGVDLDFIGKEGIRNVYHVTDPTLVKEFVHRTEQVGKNDKVFNIKYKPLLKYSQSLDGGGFDPKDYRTLLATKTAMEEIKKKEAPTDLKTYKKMLKEVATVVSEKLNNKPAQALKSYISPVVFADWRIAAGV